MSYLTTIIGRLHSGIDDTKNITRLFQKMIEVGANLEKVEYCQ
jgi:inhibitor of KinA sporulation pathway (predicted exonuclease)